MKRLLIVLAGIGALLVFATAATSGTGKTITLTAVDTSVTANQTIVLHTAIAGFPEPPSLMVVAYSGLNCSTPTAAPLTLVQFGSHVQTLDVSVGTYPAGTHSFRAFYGHGASTVSSGCVAVQVTAEQLTLSTLHATVTSADTVVLQGALTRADLGAHETVTVGMHEGIGCSSFHAAGSTAVTADAANAGAFHATFGALKPGTYTFHAESGQGASFLQSGCVTVTVTDVTTQGGTATTVVEPAVPGSSYLCWNREMASPVAYLDSVADEMWATGRYLEPYAILGNVEGGTNIGAYHLVCSVPSSMTDTGLGLGGSGEVYSAEVMAAYHVDHPVNANDLNLYHIWK